MMKFLFVYLLLHAFVIPVSALEIKAPSVPESGYQIMPKESQSFGEDLIKLLKNSIELIQPDLAEACEVCRRIIAVVLLVSTLQAISQQTKRIAELAGTAAITGILLRNTNSMIQLASQTIRELSDYGKLLCPVMTTALAAQGGVTTSTSLYVGTVFFDAITGCMISSILLPLVYVFLSLSVANASTGEIILKKISTLAKNFVNWCLKTLLIVFTTYISITGVVSGATDAAALKATKVTISSLVPVVGGIMSDAAEAVLVSAGIMKNAAGVYGIVAMLAVFLGPFMRIGLHYLLLKMTGMLCSLFLSKNNSDLIEDFTTVFGFLLAMTGTMCLLFLISTICFMKGAG